MIDTAALYQLIEIALLGYVPFIAGAVLAMVMVVFLVLYFRDRLLS
jgi:hypothetical protein